MKKLLFAALFTAAIFTTAQAQNAAAKVKKEADLVDAFTKAELSADEQKKCRAILDESNEKTKPVKADASLDEDARKEKLDAIYKERNDNLKSTMGDAKYKAFKAAQKAQKEAAAVN